MRDKSMRAVRPSGTRLHGAGWCAYTLGGRPGIKRGGGVRRPASAGALIFLAAAEDRSLFLPNTRFLLHQPMGGVRGSATDINIEAIEIIKMRDRINRLPTGW